MRIGTQGKAQILTFLSLICHIPVNSVKEKYTFSLYLLKNILEGIGRLY